MRGRLTKTVSRCLEKSNRTSRAQRRSCTTREQWHRGQLLYRSTETKNRPLTGEGLPKRARRRGGEGELNQPLGTSLPGLTIRRERKREGRWLHSDRGNVACPRRGGWMEVTMISHGVEISIAGGHQQKY